MGVCVWGGVRMTGEANRVEEGERGRGGDAKALESWRKPWVGNDPESSRSTAAGAPIRKQNAERVRIWNTDGGGGEILMSSSCRLISG